MGTLLFDKFVGVNGTHFDVHDPDIGGPWVDTTPGWQIQSNAGKATVNVCESHVEAGKKIEVVAMTFNLHGVDAGNVLVVRVGNDADDEFVSCRLSSPGFITLVQSLTAGGDVYETDVTLPATLDTVADHAILMIVGPDQVSVSLDGLLICRAPRRPAKTFSPSRITVTQGTLNAKPGPVIKSLLLN